jgi:hypothetical protein
LKRAQSVTLQVPALVAVSLLELRVVAITLLMLVIFTLIQQMGLAHHYRTLTPLQVVTYVFLAPLVVVLLAYNQETILLV